MQSLRTLVKTGRNSAKISTTKSFGFSKWSQISQLAVSSTQYDKTSLSNVTISQSYSNARISLSYPNIRKFSTYPSHQKLGLPALSPTMTKGTVLKWLKKEGDLVKAGEVIADIETDKASVGFEVQEDCYIAKILVPEGAKDIDVGKTLAIAVSTKENVAAFSNYSETSGPAKSAPAASAPAPAPATSAPAPAPAKASYPRHQVLSMPALSPTMEKGKILKWLKKEGDTVKTGESIAEVETDKASLGFEYQDDEGFIAKILQPAGTDLQVGTPVVVVVTDLSHVAAFANYQVGGQSAAPSSSSAPAAPATQTSTTAPTSSGSSNAGGRVVASPLAKVVASQNNVPLGNVQGTGPNNRIIQSDVQNYLQTATKAPQTSTPVPAKEEAKAERPKSAPSKKPIVSEASPYEEIEITNIRRVIADRLLQSKRDIPHYYLTIGVGMDALLALRNELNKESKSKISVNDCIIQASALALRDVPEVNSQWFGNVIRKFQNSDVSVAVATDTGLITPIVFNAASKGLGEIAETSKLLAKKAKENKLQPHEFVGGTFSISNLGMLGIDTFCAVINPPQAAILAVGTTEKQVVPNPEGSKDQFRVISSMNVTLSCDHRVVDGAVGAKWLARFKLYIEKPTLMLL